MSDTPNPLRPDSEQEDPCGSALETEPASGRDPEPGAVPAAVSDTEAEPRGRRRTSLLAGLLALLFLVAALVPRLQPVREVRFVASQPPMPPPVEAPVGPLAEAFTISRPATVRVEARCRGGFVGEALGIGTGFFIRSEGLLLTAYHVVDPSNTSVARCPVVYQAVTPEEERYPLELIGFDAYFDLALMKADAPREVSTIPLAIARPEPGDGVVAIGNSRGDFLAARSGSVTALGVRALRADFADDTIELTASLAPGDSGGPVLNQRGEAIGVVSYISFNPGAMDSESYIAPFLRGVPRPREFASYAVPVSISSQLVTSLLAGEQRDVPVVGLSWPSGFDSAYDPRRDPRDLGPRAGTVVARVEPESPAEAAQLRPYLQEPLLDPAGRRTGVRIEADVIVSIDGEPTRDFVELLEVVRSKRIGETVTLRVQRGGATFALPLTLGAKRSVFGQP